MTLRPLAFALLLLAACNHDVVGGGVGQPCVSSACAAGLVCESDVCAYPPSDAAASSADAASKTDAGTSTDGAIPHEDGAIGCGACNTPPDGCHALTGTCQNSVCVYDVVPGAQCDDGNACTVNDTCSASGVCTGAALVCDTPPAASCNGTTAHVYDQTGVCNGGLCVYTAHDDACAHGCTNGSCGADACAGITCTSPPSGCYAATGTCSNGSCTYAYADGASCNDNNACTTTDVCGTGVCQGVPMACNTPPANTCKDASTAQIYSPAGSCAAGTCSYSYGYESCAAGCANGACKSSGWVAATSNTTANLYAVWGASASAVWAGGYGVMVFYDGVEWEVINAGVGIGEIVTSIHGTSATNVFAAVRAVGSTRVIHYDGTSWTSLGAVPISAYNTSVFGIGTNDVLVYSLTSSSGALYRITNGTLSTLTTTSWGDIYTQPAPGLWAFSASDVYLGAHPPMHWNGTTVSTIGASTDYIYNFWAASSASIFGNESGTVDSLSSGTWSSLGFNTSSDTEINAIWGTSASRIFAAGGDVEDTGGGYVEYYDGTGWTGAVLPSGTHTLSGIYAAPTGQVFAVGSDGTIVQGP